MLQVGLSRVIISMLILAINPVIAPAESIPLSRGTQMQVEHRKMRVTAYTNSDYSMNGKGITASGEKSIEGRTIAAPPDIPLYSKIYIPKLGKTFTVTDRGGAIKGNKLDLFIESRKEALEFGVQDLDVNSLSE